LAKDLFQGAVPYYARYRIPYPETLLAEIRNRARISGQGSLLDLGCGTGEIAIRLAPFFRDVTAVDINPDMLAAGKQKSTDLGIENIMWRKQCAEQLTADTKAYELVTIGAAFHWMDRESIAQKARAWLHPGQPLVILGYTSIWSGTADWLPLVQTVIKKWLGEKRRAGSGEFPDAIDPHELVLTNAGYRLDEIKHQHSQIWTLDALIGNLYSTSFASPVVLGDKQPAFESDLRRTLLEYDSSGTYQEQMTFYALLAYPESI